METLAKMPVCLLKGYSKCDAHTGWDVRLPAASDKGERLQLDIYRATLGQARRCSFSLERNTSFITSYWEFFCHVSLVALGMSVPFCLFVHHFGTYWNISTTAGLSVFWYGYHWISSSSTSRSEILLSGEISQHLRDRSAQNLQRMNTNDFWDHQFCYVPFWMKCSNFSLNNSCSTIIRSKFNAYAMVHHLELMHCNLNQLHPPHC